MSINNWVVSLLVVAVAGIGAYTFTRPTVTQSPPLGSASSPSVIDGCVQVEAGGAQMCFRSSAMRLASTTCSLRSPTSASSTLVSAFARADRTPLATTQFEWGKGKDAYSTTTGMGITSLATNLRGTMTATSSALTVLDDVIVFSPGDYLNFKVGSSTPTNLAGECVAMWLTQ